MGMDRQTWYTGVRAIAAILSGSERRLAVIRVFILSGHLLFARGVESLLRRQAGVEVIGCERDEEQAVERIRELHPDVVILDDDPSAEGARLALLRILREAATPRIIGLNLQSNTLCIYRGERRLVGGTEDLLEAIGPPPLNDRGHHRQPREEDE